jgi:hypothetical protein
MHKIASELTPIDLEIKSLQKKATASPLSGEEQERLSTLQSR